MGEALNVNWEAIREAAIAGVPFKVLASQNGLFDKKGKPYTGAIRVRAMREKWPVVTRLMHEAKKQAKRANEAREAAMQLRQSLNPSQANPPNDTLVHRERETSIEEIEPGLEESGFMGDYPKNQGIREHGNGFQGSKGAQILGDSASNPASKGSGSADSRALPMNQGSRNLDSGEGTKGLLSIGEVGNASQHLQASESLAATLIQNHMAQLANESIMQALTRAHASIHAAPAQLPIATIADLRSAMKLAQEATGLDSKQNNQTLNILVHPTPKAGTWNFSNESQLPAIDLE